MRPINFTNSAAAPAQVKWTVDADCDIVAMLADTAALVTTDPSATIANTQTTPAVTGWNDQWMICLITATTDSTGWKIPLSKDSTIYVNFAGKDVLQLWLEDRVSAE